MLKLIAAAAALIPWAAAALPAVAQTGPARVVDGDTIDLAGTRIQLRAIDAPESQLKCERLDGDYACGQEATAYLQTLIAGGEVVCRPRTEDRLDRTVAVYRVGGIDIGAAMVRDGWALAFVKCSGDNVA